MQYSISEQLPSNSGISQVYYIRKRGQFTTGLGQQNTSSTRSHVPPLAVSFMVYFIRCTNKQRSACESNVGCLLKGRTRWEELGDDSKESNKLINLHAFIKNQLIYSDQDLPTTNLVKLLTMSDRKYTIWISKRKKAGNISFCIQGVPYFMLALVG